MPPVIRSATPADISALIAMEQQVPTAAHWNREHYLRRIEAGIFFVVEDEVEIVGFICASRVVDDVEIENVVVAQKFRRRGIGRQLLLTLVGQARTTRAAGLSLEVRESSLPARAFYREAGFREVGRRKAYYRDPIEDAILYSFRLETDTEDGP